MAQVQRAGDVGRRHDDDERLRRGPRRVSRHHRARRRQPRASARRRPARPRPADTPWPSEPCRSGLRSCRCSPLRHTDDLARRPGRTRSPMRCRHRVLRASAAPRPPSLAQGQLSSAGGAAGWLLNPHEVEHDHACAKVAHPGLAKVTADGVSLYEVERMRRRRERVEFDLHEVTCGTARSRAARRGHVRHGGVAPGLHQGRPARGEAPRGTLRQAPFSTSLA